MLYCQQYNLNRNPKKQKAITPEDFLGKKTETVEDWRLVKVYFDTLIAQQDRKKRKNKDGR